MDNHCNQCGNPLNDKHQCEKCGHINGGAFNVISDKVKSYDYKGKAKALKAKANETIDKAKSYDYKGKAAALKAKANETLDKAKNYDYKETADKIAKTIKDFNYEKKAKVPSLNKIIIIGVAAIMAIITAIIFLNGNNFKAKKIQKIYPGFSDIKIVCAEPLEDNWEYVLFSTKTNNGEMYLCDAIDFKNEVNYNGTIANPFYSLFAYVCTQSDEETNKKLFWEMKKIIDEGGLDYFNDTKNSSDFLRKVSGANGIIPTAEARNMMILSLGLIYGEDFANELSQKEDYKILFEYKNAYPKVITYKTTEKKYNWNYPESALGYMDYETKQTFNSLFGPAYIPEIKWRYSVVDEETGDIEDFVNYCASLEDVKSKYDVYEIGDIENGKYIGEWKDGVRNGQGTYIYVNGNKYEGEWRNGKRHGQGIMYWADIDKYEGEWINDKRTGQGTYYWSNGDKYEGEWKDDIMNGQGTYYKADGTTTSGEWKNGKFIK